MDGASVWSILLHTAWLLAWPAWLDRQAGLFGQLDRDVPALCGELPPESTIYVQNSPVFDITRDRVIMALNVAYSDVFVTSAQGVETADAIAPAQFDCAVLYDGDPKEYTLFSRVFDGPLCQTAKITRRI